MNKIQTRSGNKHYGSQRGEDENWVHLARDRFQQALVNIVINLQVSLKVRNILTN
jgi:hypothetical protein